MDITVDFARTDWQLEQILMLQQSNLPGAADADEQEAQGFVFAQHTLPVLQAMADHLPQTIALHNGKVVGYTLAMTPNMVDVLPSLTPMFREFERCTFRGRPLSSYRFMIGGQVCVDKNYRGQGLLKRLYHACRDQLPKDYQLCVTEIATHNVPSCIAHRKMGFETIRTYSDGITDWNIVAWPMKAHLAP